MAGHCLAAQKVVERRGNGSGFGEETVMAMAAGDDHMVRIRKVARDFALLDMTSDILSSGRTSRPSAGRFQRGKASCCPSSR